MFFTLAKVPTLAKKWSDFAERKSKSKSMV